MGETKERVTIEFGADGTKLESGVSGLQRKVQRAGDEMSKGFRLKGERAVKAQFAGFLQDINGVTSGTQVAAAALSHFGESLQVSIGAMAGITLGIALWDKYSEAVKAARERQIELTNAVIKSATPGAGASEISKSIDDLTKLRDQAQTASQPGFFGTLANQTGQFIETAAAGAGIIDDNQRFGDPAQAAADQKAEAEKNIRHLLGEQTTEMQKQAGILFARLTVNDKTARFIKEQVDLDEAKAAVEERFKELNVGTAGFSDQIEAAQTLVKLQSALTERTEEQAQAQRSSAVAGALAASQAAQFRSQGMEFDAKSGEEAQRDAEALLKVNQQNANGLFKDQGEYNQAIEAEQRLHSTNIALISQEEDIRAATLATETQIAFATGKASDKKLAALRAEIALQKEIENTTTNVVTRQEAANKAQEYGNQLAQGEITQHRQTGAQRAQETRDAHAIERQLRIDAAKNKKNDASGTHAFLDRFLPKIPDAIVKRNPVANQTQLIADACMTGVQNALQGNLIVAQLA